MRIFLLFLTLSLIVIPLEWYTYQGIKTLTHRWKSPQWQQLVRKGYWVLMAGLMISLVMAFLLSPGNHSLTPFAQGIINTIITLLVTKLAFVLILFGEDIYRMVVAVFRYFKKQYTTTTEDKPFLPERRKWISQAGLMIAGIPFVSFIYGISRGKYEYKVHRQILYFDDLPENFDGFTITQLSDIHAGSFDNHEAVQRGIDLAKAQHSDLFVFTGDLVNNVADEVAPWIDHFKQLQAPYGQFSILGNHDYGDYAIWDSEAEKQANMERLKQYHASMGYRLLTNEHITLEKGGHQLVLLGVENWGNGFIQKGDLEKTLAGVDDHAFKVLLSHDPSHWQEKVKHHPVKIQLTLSGHTHGMQFGVEVPGYQWSPVQYRYAHWAGLAHVNQRQLYVNRGFGFIGFSGRVGIWPEITVIELRKATA